MSTFLCLYATRCTQGGKTTSCCQASSINLLMCLWPHKVRRSTALTHEKFSLNANVRDSLRGRSPLPCHLGCVTIFLVSPFQRRPSFPLGFRKAATGVWKALLSGRISLLHSDAAQTRHRVVHPEFKKKIWSSKLPSKLLNLPHAFIL